MKASIQDLRYAHDEVVRQLELKNDEYAILGRDILSWRDAVERLNSENQDMKGVIEDLESKNRKLVEKLNEFIYNKATEYKERTLQALAKNDSPNKLKRAIKGPNPSDERLN